MSPFLSACSYVSALLGPADSLRARVEVDSATLPALARWGREGGVSLTVTDGVNDLVATLRAERLDGDFRVWRSIGDGTVRDACAWLGWSVPRHSPAFLAAFGEASALLGAASRIELLPMLASVAEWQGDDGAWTLDDYDGECSLTLTLPDGRDHGSVIAPPAYTVAAAVAECRARVLSGFDANGSPVEAA